MPEDQATPVLLIDATYRIGEDDAATFVALALRMAAAAEQRDGCAFVKAARDLAEPATFRLLEGWRDRAALDAHLASDAFQAVLKEAAGLKLIERSIDLYSVDNATQLDMPS